MGDVGVSSEPPELGHQVWIEQDPGADSDDPRALGRPSGLRHFRRRARARCCRACRRRVGGRVVQVPHGANGCRVGAHVSVRTRLCRDLRQVVAPVMDVAGALDSARDEWATGSEPPSSTQTITGAACTNSGSAWKPGRERGGRASARSEHPVGRGRTCSLGRDDSSSWAKRWPHIHVARTSRLLCVAVQRDRRPGRHREQGRELRRELLRE